MQPDLAQPDWLASLRTHRQAKDRVFESRMSPLPTESRPRFAGLRYYEPDPAWRATAALREETPREMVIARTQGDHVFYLRLGTFRLDLPGGHATLAAFRTGNEAADEVFIPFRDGTSGSETHGGGRYLEARRQADGQWLIDFNHAYHPYCAYNETYSCPLPPRENWIMLAVRAGERLPDGA